MSAPLRCCMQRQTVNVTTTGSAGVAAGTGATGVYMRGRLVGVYIDYTSQPSTTDVTIATKTAPIQTLLTRTNANTDAWFYPRIAVHDNTGTAISFAATFPVYDWFRVDDVITVTVAQGDAITDGVVVTILVEKD